jgi:hypothetical protein
MNVTVSEYRVMETPAGYYVGQQCFDPEMPEFGMTVPYDRITHYMDTSSDARRVLEALVLDMAYDDEWNAVEAYHSALNSFASTERAVEIALSIPMLMLQAQAGDADLNEMYGPQRD